MKKQLNTTQMISNLSESPFFTPLPQEKQVPEAHQMPPETPTVVKPVTPAFKAVAPLEPIVDDTPPLEGKYPIKSKRVKLQMPFNFWEDQIIKMREIRDRKIAKNEYFSMAEVVRNALDDYLKKNY